MILAGDMDGGEMPTAVQASKHDGIEAIGLAVVAGSSGNQRWSDHLAVEAVVG
jgi:hypothetical protein